MGEWIKEVEVKSVRYHVVLGGYPFWGSLDDEFVVLIGRGLGEIHWIIVERRDKSLRWKV